MTTGVGKRSARETLAKLARESKNKHGEQTLAFQLQSSKLPVAEREYRFADAALGRKWRFDFAWPEYHIAVEIDGGTWSGGRHVRGSGARSDSEKFSTAAALGWRVIRLTTEMVEDGSGLMLIEAAFGQGEVRAPVARLVQGTRSKGG